MRHELGLKREGQKAIFLMNQVLCNTAGYSPAESPGKCSRLVSVFSCIRKQHLFVNCCGIGLICCQECSTDLCSISTKCQCSSNTFPVCNTTCGDNRGFYFFFNQLEQYKPSRCRCLCLCKER